MASSGIVFENGEKFAQALLANPTAKFLRSIVQEAANVVDAERRKAPAQTGATAGTSGKHSTGNLKTTQRSYYARTVGSFYVRKDGMQTAGKRSQDLANSFERSVSNGGLTVSLRSTGVDYAGFVRGGRDESQKQSRVMQARGWQTVDQIADAVVDDITQIVDKSLRAAWKNYLQENGITST